MNKDAYIIHQRHPEHPCEFQPLQAGADITLYIQKFHFHKNGGDYEQRPVFRYEIPLHLHVLNYEKRDDGNYGLPYVFDGHPRHHLPIKVAKDACLDPVLRALHPSFRLVFRYNPERDLGVLVHFGYDFARVDDAPLRYLWESVVNQNEYHVAETVAAAEAQHNLIIQQQAAAATPTPIPSSLSTAQAIFASLKN